MDKELNLIGNSGYRLKNRPANQYYVAQEFALVRAKDTPTNPIGCGSHFIEKDGTLTFSVALKGKVPAQLILEGRMYPMRVTGRNGVFSIYEIRLPAPAGGCAKYHFKAGNVRYPVSKATLTAFGTKICPIPLEHM
jgi:hypothetical protein